jgi:hypothetical protein
MYYICTALHIRNVPVDARTSLAYRPSPCTFSCLPLIFARHRENSTSLFGVFVLHFKQCLPYFWSCTHTTFKSHVIQISIIRSGRPHPLDCTAFAGKALCVLAAKYLVFCPSSQPCAALGRYMCFSCVIRDGTKLRVTHTNTHTQKPPSLNSTKIGNFAAYDSLACISNFDIPRHLYKGRTQPTSYGSSMLYDSVLPSVCRAKNVCPLAGE